MSDGRPLVVEITHCIMDIMMLYIPLYGMIMSGMSLTAGVQTWRSPAMAASSNKHQIGRN